MHSSEDTLRVYVAFRHPYPLLNPRFVRRSFSGLKGRDFLEINVLSNGDEELGRKLRSYAPTAACAFFTDGSKRARHFYHGVFAVPLPFRRKADAKEIDFVALGSALRSVLDHLRQAV